MGDDIQISISDLTFANAENDSYEIDPSIKANMDVFEKYLNSTIEEFSKAHYLEKNNFSFDYNVDEDARKKRQEKNSKAIVKSLCFVEYEYPPNQNKLVQGTVLSPVIRVEFMMNSTDLIIPTRINDDYPFRGEALSVKPIAGGFTKIKLSVENVTDEVFDYIFGVIEYRYANYTTSSDDMGCCSSFEACSDVKHCIHENQLYAKKCIYRRNLEAGRIFYGANRNV